MINKIIFTIDFLTHSFENNCTYHFWFVKLLKRLIYYATNLEILELKNLDFDRKEFFNKSSITDIKESYYLYDISKIKKESIDYLKQFVDSDCFIIGVELGEDIKNIFDNLNVSFINFWFHPYKLFDDAIFMMNTNNVDIFNILTKYKIPEEYFYFYADYFNIYIENNLFNDDKILDNSALFIGQTSIDVSVKKGNEFLNILNFKDYIEKLSNDYSKIYYCPHPLEKDILEVNEYINSIDYVELINDIPTYFLLTSNKIKKVISISSSVLYEAKYFGKDVEYLYKPLFRIDEDFSINTFISINNDYFNPYFWSDILSPIMNTNKNTINKILFNNSNNKIRNIKNIYYGYAYLDKDISFQNYVNNNMHQISNSINLINDSIKQRNIQINNEIDIKINCIDNKINNLINKIAWFIPIKKWRDMFRKNL